MRIPNDDKLLFLTHKLLVTSVQFVSQGDSTNLAVILALSMGTINGPSSWLKFLTIAVEYRP